MNGATPNRFATVIAGPTASGKSGLAARLAAERGGVVVNADSMQVYRELRLLTARPGPEEEAALPHRLYGFRSAREPYSVAEWLRDVTPMSEEARAGGAPLIIVGGTGLYFKALFEGLSPVPEIPAEIRDHWRGQASALGGPALHEVLRRRDPALAERLVPSDPQRLVRALEVLDATGRSLLEWQQVRGKGLLAEAEADRLLVTLPRDALYARCDARLDAMIEAGALDEVRRLAEMNLDLGLPLMRAVGLRPLLDHVNGLIALEAALAAAKTETRRYAKRQMTWARSNMISWSAVLRQ